MHIRMSMSVYMYVYAITCTSYADSVPSAAAEKSRCAPWK